MQRSHMLCITKQCAKGDAQHAENTVIVDRGYQQVCPSQQSQVLLQPIVQSENAQ